MKGGRKLVTLGCLAAVGLALGAGIRPAKAQYYYYSPAPVYVAPAPVYGAPAPVYYAPPTVVYRAPVYRTYGVYHRHYVQPRYHGHRSFSFGFGYHRW